MLETEFQSGDETVPPLLCRNLGSLDRAQLDRTKAMQKEQR